MLQNLPADEDFGTKVVTFGKKFCLPESRFGRKFWRGDDSGAIFPILYESF